MIDLDFTVEGAEIGHHSVSPLLLLKLRVGNAIPAASVENVVLQAQIRIEVTHRHYGPRERERLRELFGATEEWDRTLHGFYWTNVSASLPTFTATCMVDLPVPCSYDFNIAATKYFYGLEQGDIPLLLLFSGTVFFRNAEGDLQICQIAHHKEASYRLPVRIWQAMMDRYYPDSVWMIDLDFTIEEEAREREVIAAPLPLDRLTAAPVSVPFAFPGEREIEPVRAADARIVALILRTTATIEGEISTAVQQIADGLYRVTVRVHNLTPLPPATGRDAAQRAALASTHTLLGVRDGSFLSLLDPPAECRAAAAECANHGTWPVLVGEAGSADMLLSSPIILYDYPRIAPESPGDLFGGTEIDEILTLRILTLTVDEKREMAAADPRTRALLQRTEALTPEALGRLHGAFRAPRSGMPQGQTPAGPVLSVGDRVRLKPKAGGDIMDAALTDRIAVVEAIERDFEDRLYIAVTMLDDPGCDLGLAHMPGHRFFFAPDELERLAPGAAS